MIQLFAELLRRRDQVALYEVPTARDADKRRGGGTMCRKSQIPVVRTAF